MLYFTNTNDDNEAYLWSKQCGETTFEGVSRAWNARMSPGPYHELTARGAYGTPDTRSSARIKFCNDLIKTAEKVRRESDWDYRCRPEKEYGDVSSNIQYRYCCLAIANLFH